MKGSGITRYNYKCSWIKINGAYLSAKIYALFDITVVDFVLRKGSVSKKLRN